MGDPGPVRSRLQPHSKGRGNGCYSYYSYDAAGRLTIGDHRLPSGGSLAYFGYAYDAASRITSVVRDAGMSIYYNYDDADRLTGENWYNSAGSNIYAFNWNYDAVGNRTYQSYNGAQTYYQYNVDNALTQLHDYPADAWTYWQYDAKGNCTQINAPNGSTYFAYNGLNLMTSVLFRTGVANYFWYDAKQRRYAIQESTGTTYFTYDTDGLCELLERNSAGSIVAEYTRGYAPIAGIGDRTGATLITSQGTYYQYDASGGIPGNIVKLTNAQAEVVASFEYDAWGNFLSYQPPPEGTRYGQSAPAWIIAKDDPDRVLRFSPERAAHAAVGKWLQREPILQLAGRFAHLSDATLRIIRSKDSIDVNEYVFCSNSPLMNVDPRGTQASYSPGEFDVQLVGYNWNIWGDSSVNVDYWPKDECHCQHYQYLQIDSIDGEPLHPDNGAGNHGFYTTEENDSMLGHRTIHMDDNPGAEGVHLVNFKQDFITCVACKEGLDLGKIYGCIRWGASYSKIVWPIPGMVLIYVELDSRVKWYSSHDTLRSISIGAATFAGSRSTEMLTQMSSAFAQRYGANLYY